MKTAALILISAVLLFACSSAKLSTGKEITMKSKFNGHQRMFAGTIDSSSVIQLKNFLRQNTGEEPKDTIIIKYNFDGETCWNFLDQQTDEHIQKVIDGMHNYIDTAKRQRPGLSIFRYRERGSNTNKYILRDGDIKIDDGFLRSNYFTEYAQCGTSLMVLPSGHWLMLKYDSHFEMLMISKAGAEALLQSK